jgi:hypothetical protein
MKLKYASDKTFKEKLEIWFVKDHNKGKTFIVSREEKVFPVFKLNNIELNLFIL